MGGEIISLSERAEAVRQRKEAEEKKRILMYEASRKNKWQRGALKRHSEAIRIHRELQEQKSFWPYLVKP